jgi:hypothetical protein
MDRRASTNGSGVAQASCYCRSSASEIGCIKSGLPITAAILAVIFG